MSGAEVWQIEGEDRWEGLAPPSAPPSDGSLRHLALRHLALRAWPPEHPSSERLNWMHRVLGHVAERGLRANVPVPLADSQGHTFLRHAGRLWELAPWLPGELDESQPPRSARVASAFRLLARFHSAVADFPDGCPDFAVLRGPQNSPGITERRQRLERLLAGRYQELRIAVAAAQGPLGWPALEGLAVRWLDLFPRLAPRSLADLEAGCRCPVDLIPCLRDIKRDHVLFAGDEATGLVDFGALRPETVAADLGRLVGSFAGDDRALRALALKAYESERPFAPHERSLVDTFDTSGLLLGGANWIEWVVVERREFDDRRGVERRLAEIVERLAQWADRG